MTRADLYTASHRRVAAPAKPVAPSMRAAFVKQRAKARKKRPAPAIIPYQSGEIVALKGLPGVLARVLGVYPKAGMLLIHILPECRTEGTQMFEIDHERVEAHE